MTRSSFTFVVVLLSAQLCLYVVLCQDEDSHINTSLLSSVLDRLTNRTTYDKRLRPRYGEKPVDVGITIHVSSISAVSEVDMDFTLDFYMRQTWQDPRLAFGSLDLGLSKEIDSLTVGVDYLDKLWKPDTFFPNEKKSFFHLATTHNSFLRIDSDGTVYTSQRLTVTATCPMDLKLFPMDSQHCKLEIESYGYQTKDIDYYWGKKRTDLETTAVKFDTFQLPQFQPTLYFVNTTKAETSSGKYVRLALEVILVRNMGFYTMNIVIPSILIVTISWVSFWLNREASPARVGLGVTTVLTMTTLITTTNNSMPKVSYVKGLDVFLNFCFVMVFASLLEYAIVSYMNKRLVLRREKRRKAAEQQQRNEMPMFNASPKAANNNADLYFAGHNSSMNPLMEIPENCDCRTIPMMQHPRLVTDGAHTLWPAPFARPKKASKTCCQRWTPAKIDKLSRYCFPLSFSVFNVVYWLYMKYLSLNSSDKIQENDKWQHIHCALLNKKIPYSDAYSTAEIEYNWCTSKEPNCATAVKADENIELSSYQFTKICQKRTLASTSSGTYSRLRVSFIFDRDSGFYFLQIFFPASLVVVLSWISFWINRDSAPSRTLIGTMTVLTETHLMTGTNRRLPPVAYVKAVDVFLGFCYLLVILALIEYACVAYSKKKNEDRRRREKKMEHKPAPPTPDILHDVRLAECTCNAAPTSIIAVIKQPNRFCVSHSHIDIVSRAAFPIVFIVFNIVFWLMLLYKSKRLPYISEHEGDRCDAPDLH